MQGASLAAAIGGAAPPDRAVQLRKVAQEFEAVAIGEMLSPMFDTVDTSRGFFGGGEGESAWRPMMIQAIGQQMAAHGGLGLADAIFHTLMRAQETGQEGVE